MFVPTAEQLPDAPEYVAWGDRRAVEVARSVPADGCFAEQNISFGSVHKLLVHMMGSRATWLARLRGTSPTRTADPAEFPTLAAVEAHWPTVHAGLLAFAAGQTPATLAGPLSYRTTAGVPVTIPLGQAMLHAADHAMYPRGQLNSMAKRAGGRPLPIMRYTWLLERQASGE